MSNEFKDAVEPYTKEEFLESIRSDMEKDLRDATILEGGDPNSPEVKITTEYALNDVHAHHGGDERSTRTTNDLITIFKKESETKSG